MAKGIKKFVKLAVSRLFRPFKPLIKPLRHPLVLTLVLTGVLLTAIGGRFYPAGIDYDLLEAAARQPWQTQANYLKVSAEIAAWEKLAIVRPYSKDLLIKLALLYDQIGEVQKALDYFNQAQYLDPTISPLPFSRP